jgi:ABC-type lipoprotein release transport system permease subunit
MALVVKTSSPPERVAAAVRGAVLSLAPALPMPAATPMARTLEGALGQPRLRAWLLTFFALAALALSAVGLYGTMAFAVEQCRREFAIRLVLGATPHAAQQLVIREGLAISGVGTALGVAAAWPLMGLLSAFLFGVHASDPRTIVVVAAVLLAVSGIASYLPARRVFEIDPLKAVQPD